MCWMTLQEIHEMQDTLGVTRLFLENTLKFKSIREEAKDRLLKPVTDAIDYLADEDAERRNNTREAKKLSEEQGIPYGVHVELSYKIKKLFEEARCSLTHAEYRMFVQSIRDVLSEVGDDFKN